MNQIVFVVLAAVAMLNMHVARGDGCKATVDGKEVSLQDGDRYCLDETTSQTCNADGQFTTDKCPPGSKCLKSSDSHRTLCRELKRNVASSAEHKQPEAPKQPEQPQQPKETPSAPAPAPKDQNDQAPTTSDKETCQANIDGKDTTLKTGERYCVDSVSHRVCNYGVWVDDKCPQGSNCLKSPNAWNVLCRELRKNPPQPDHPAVRARRDADKAETCQATIEGKSETVPTGARYCVDQTTHRVCNYGEWIDDKCPSGSVCLKSPTSFQVLCRIVNLNQKQPEHPTQDSEPQPNPAPAPAPAPAPVPAAAPAPAPAPAPGTDAPAPPAPGGETPPPAPGTEAPLHPGTDGSCAGGLKNGENVCLSDTTYKQCNNGALITDSCPQNSKCLKSETSNAVLCREIRLNPKP